MHERPDSQRDRDTGENGSQDGQNAVAITGIFYHSSFSRRSYLTTGRRLADFPGALEFLLRHPHVRLFECPAAGDELILLAHDRDLIPQVEADPL